MLVVQGCSRRIAIVLFCELAFVRIARVVDSDWAWLRFRKVSIFSVWRCDLSLLGVLFMRILG